MMRPIQVAHRWLARLIVVAVAVQFLLAGAGAFGATSFKAHTALGWATAAGSLLTLVIAALGHSQRRASSLLFAAVAVQVALGVLGENSSPWFGAVHGLNALVVAGAAVNLAWGTAGTRGPRSVSRLDSSASRTGTPSP